MVNVETRRNFKIERNNVRAVKRMIHPNIDGLYRYSVMKNRFSSHSLGNFKCSIRILLKKSYFAQLRFYDEQVFVVGVHCEEHANVS